MEAVDIGSMSLEELAALKGNFESEVEELRKLCGALGGGLGRFEQALIAVQALGEDQAQVLVPVTDALYAPGRLETPDKLMVDVGTGYFINKTREQTLQYLGQKLDTLRDKEQEAQTALLRKEESLQTIGQVMQIRVQSMMQQRQ